jgi:hypothetical protein
MDTVHTAHQTDEHSAYRTPRGWTQCTPHTSRMDTVHTPHLADGHNAYRIPRGCNLVRSVIEMKDVWTKQAIEFGSLHICRKIIAYGGEDVQLRTALHIPGIMHY